MASGSSFSVAHRLAAGESHGPHAWRQSHGVPPFFCWTCPHNPALRSALLCQHTPSVAGTEYVIRCCKYRDGAQWRFLPPRCQRLYTLPRASLLSGAYTACSKQPPELTQSNLPLCYAAWLLQGSALFDRLHETCEPGGSGMGRRAMTMAHLKDQARDQLKRPSFLVLCSPSGLPVKDVIQQLAAQHPGSTGRIVTHSSRMPLVSRPSYHRPAISSHER